MILVDVNLLVAAVMTESPDHQRCRDWLDGQLSGTIRVGLPWAALTGFVRVASQARAWERPLPVDQALAVVRAWSAQRCTWVPEPGPRHLELLESLLGGQSSARLVPDAHLAAIAVEHGLELCSRDRDFRRWSEQGLRSRDPLA